MGTFHGFNLLDVFQHLAYRGQMTDLARYAINFFKGGVYADIDVYNYRNIREMFECASGGVRESQSSGDLGSPPFAPFFYAVTEKPSLQQANYFFAVKMWRIAIKNERATCAIHATLMLTQLPSAIGIFRACP